MDRDDLFQNKTVAVAMRTAASCIKLLTVIGTLSGDRSRTTDNLRSANLISSIVAFLPTCDDNFDRIQLAWLSRLSMEPQ